MAGAWIYDERRTSGASQKLCCTEPRAGKSVYGDLALFEGCVMGARLGVRRHERSSQRG